MKENSEIGHICKWCNKSFSNGKSLGGHTRGHLHAIKSADNCKKMNDSEMGLLKKTTGRGRGRPRKSCPVSDQKPIALKNQNLCKQCGKGFESPRALYGHMRCHSDKGKQQTDVIQDPSMERIANPKRKRSKKMHMIRQFRTCLSNFENDPELEEIALCLLMLSRGDDGRDGCRSCSLSCSESDSVNLEAKLSGEDTQMAKYIDNYDDEERMLWNPTLAQ